MHIVESTTRPFDHSEASALRNGRSPERATEGSDSSRFASREVDGLPLALLDIVSDGIVVTSPASLGMSCNENVATMVGLPLCMVLDERVGDYFSSEDAVAFQNLIAGRGTDNRSSRQGAGLGLSQVYAFVKRCKGFVTIESVVGSGTSVFLFLPRTP